ncbi:MAG: zinc-binding dehydrogenase [Candidatus Eremiobacterota bacterium]
MPVTTATMRAAVYRGPEGLVLEEVPRPQPEEGEILVKVAACGLCHTDLHYLDHGVPTFRKPPVVLGHECSGTVEESTVKEYSSGDRVLLPAVLTCGRCDLCRQGRENICSSMAMLGNHIDGAYAEWIKVPAKDVYRLPPDLPLEESAVIADALTTPYHAVVRRGQVRAGDRVVVIGCGGVGLGLVQFARAVGARVVGLDVQPAKLALARELGAVAAFDGREEGVAKKVRAALGGAPEVVFEAIGHAPTLQQAVALAGAGGRVVVVGYCSHDVELPASKIMFRELDVVGSLGCRPVDYPRVIDMVRSGAIRLGPMVSHRFALAEIHQGLDALRRGEMIRGIVVP